MTAGPYAPGELPYCSIDPARLAPGGVGVQAEELALLNSLGWHRIVDGLAGDPGTITDYSPSLPTNARDAGTTEQPTRRTHR